MKLERLFLLARIIYKLLHCVFRTVSICKKIWEEPVGIGLLKIEIAVYLLPYFLWLFAYSFTISRYYFLLNQLGDSHFKGIPEALAQERKRPWHQCSWLLILHHRFRLFLGQAIVGCFFFADSRDLNPQI